MGSKSLAHVFEQHVYEMLHSRQLCCYWNIIVSDFHWLIKKSTPQHVRLQIWPADTTFCSTFFVILCQIEQQDSQSVNIYHSFIKIISCSKKRINSASCAEWNIKCHIAPKKRLDSWSLDSHTAKTISPHAKCGWVAARGFWWQSDNGAMVRNCGPKSASPNHRELL